MSVTLLIVVGLLALSGLVTLLLAARSVIARVAASILALGCAAFCAFGFLASFEPSDSPNWPWKVGYGVLGIGALVAAALVLRKGVRVR